MIFEFEHHNQILKLLRSLDSDLLLRSHAYFGEGTVLALDFQEYRHSQDVDFICSIARDGYKTMRSHLYDHGYHGLFLDHQSVIIHRGTMDQYGVRLLVEIDRTPIKLEIIAEARFVTDLPRFFAWSLIPCLSIEDCFVSKLLANADCYGDTSIKSRDLIDLAMLRIYHPLSKTIITKAENAYEVIRPLKRAIQHFQDKQTYREECFVSLQIRRDNWPKVIDGLDLLAQDLDLPITPRKFWEQTPLGQ